MYEQLIPCDHCGGRPTVGRSQRVISDAPDPWFDRTRWGRFGGPPAIGDMMMRPPEAPKTERVVCIYCAECGMQTPWTACEEDDTAARNSVAEIWNRRVNRPEASKTDLQRLAEREIGTSDIPAVLDLLSRTKGDWEQMGPLFAMLARRLVDATVVTFDSWPIDPVLNDAARYRKLVQLTKWVDIDGERYVQFPKVYTHPEDRDRLFEDVIASAVDSLPDRDRW
ncbi:Lar family restriction alleviation protein [Paraburkholderia sp. CNPSo 3076]|uniref:Lar family restriction alleviation protein n=1 Tax=Paraburkholderia sp. CNPSo 3076 TaxID=2940936 RepID=UPI002251A56F|nr:Lar family restriction alleviation protein [Paraburkholderia sp. CNPSo 3076]MCX5545506.1 Lar family restriction alleviation protein [Paraburkholderia sp. CNPSo 3076]